MNDWVEKDANGVDVPILTSVGGFYYFDQFKFTPVAGFEDFRPVDSTLSILSDDRFQKSFKNEGIIVKDGPTVEAGLDMIAIPSEAIVEHSSDDWYICYGHTSFGLVDDGVHLKWDTTIHENMKYDSENGDYYVLTPAEPIDGKAWHGISGGSSIESDRWFVGYFMWRNSRPQCHLRDEYEEGYVSD